MRQKSDAVKNKKHDETGKRQNAGAKKNAKPRKRKKNTEKMNENR